MGNPGAAHLGMIEPGVKRSIMRDTMAGANEILQLRHDGFRLGLPFKQMKIKDGFSSIDTVKIKELYFACLLQSTP